MDYFDILDENDRPTGYTRSRVEAHEKGLWHRTVHIWIVNDRQELLLQKRATNLVSHPGKWDISVGGHVHAGESSIESAVREIKEELGLDAKPDELEFLFTLKSQSVQNNKTFINNEFSDTYIFKRSVKLEELKFDPKEVSELKFVLKKELEKMYKNNDKTIVNNQREFKKLISYLDK